MTYVLNGEGGDYQCDECGRTSNDPLPGLLGDGDGPRDRWARLEIQQMYVDLCSVCVRMKLGLALQTLRRKMKEVPR